jgi:hypothetical protein
MFPSSLMQSPGPIEQIVLCRVLRAHSPVYIRHSYSSVLPIVPNKTGHKSGHCAHYSGTPPAIECLPEHKVH